MVVGGVKKKKMHKREGVRSGKEGLGVGGGKARRANGNTRCPAARQEKKEFFPCRDDGYAGESEGDRQWWSR